MNDKNEKGLNDLLEREGVAVEKAANLKGSWEEYKALEEALSDFQGNYEGQFRKTTIKEGSFFHKINLINEIRDIKDTFGASSLIPALTDEKKIGQIADNYGLKSPEKERDSKFFLKR